MEADNIFLTELDLFFSNELSGVLTFKEPDNVYEGFDECLKKITRIKNDSTTSEIIFKIFDFYIKALKQARSNKLPLAKESILKADSFLELFDHNGSEIVYSLSYPIKAYYEYKVHNFQEAEGFLSKAFHLDEKLEREGYFILVMHRIQVMHNLCRMYFKYNVIEGFNLSLKLLNLITENQDLLHSQFHIKRSSLDCINWGLKSAMFYQILDELVLQIMIYPELRAKMVSNLKNSLFQHASIQLRNKGNLLTWLELNVSSLEGNLKLHLIVQILMDIKHNVDFTNFDHLIESIRSYLQTQNILPYYKNQILQLIEKRPFLQVQSSILQE
jgi:hypothetical protein